MQKKRIIFITREIVPFYYGGIGTQFKAAAKFLKQHGHDVYLLTQRHESFDEEIYKRNYGDIPLFFVNVPELSTSFPLPFTYALEVVKIFDEIYSQVHPDIVICADFGAEGYFLFLKSHAGDYENTRFILTINGLSYNTISMYESGMSVLQRSELNDPQNIITCAMEDMSVLLADEIITPSALYWQELQSRLKIKKDANIIPNFVDKDLFNPHDFHGSYNRYNRLILFIGRLDRNKGADLLLKAYLEIVKDCSDIKPRIIFIGRDCFWKEHKSTFLEYWQKQIPRSCVDNISFLGQVDHDQIVNYLKNATVCVFPSRWEVFGIVCLEAMSCGCPVLVSKGTGLEEILGTSFSNYVFDVTKGEVVLKQKLVSILRNSTKLSKLQVKLFERAQELTNMSESRFLGLVERGFKQKTKISVPQLISFYGKAFQLFSALNDVVFNNSTGKQKNFLQVYFPKNNTYSEPNSITIEYPKSQWVNLKIDLPYGIPEGNLRLDPSNNAGVISIKEIVIIDKKTDKEIWKADFSNEFKECEVLGNDRYVLNNKYLVIWAATDDPQILINSPVIDQPARMKVTLSYGVNIVGEDQIA